jgi:tricarballylate dehydrogenase
MNREARSIVIVGQGAAGLAAALAAAQNAPAHGEPIRITVIDKAPESEAGGNTRWSPSNMRMTSPEHVESSFVQDMLTATQFRGDESYFARLAEEAPSMAQWLKSHGIEFIQPPYYLSKGPPRIQPLGGGGNLTKVLTNAAKDAGVTFRYNCCARAIEIRDERVVGVAIEHGETSNIVPADAIVLACGGFEGNAAMMRAYLGEGAETMRLISPGTRFNTGDGIEMALRVGADKSGDWSGMHCEPVDVRSKNSAPVVLIYPYGIVIDKAGRRFFDEGGGLMHETWEWLARHIHFETPGSIAYAVIDSRLFEIPDYERAIRSEVAPARADTLPGLAKTIGVDARGLVETVTAYNAACTGDPDTFDATFCDGLAAVKSLHPGKSHWARAIRVPPFLAYPLVGAVAYTFGGLATDNRSRVLRDGKPIPDLFAAGEITGHFYATAPNSVSVLRALVFGRIAGAEAVHALKSKKGP